VAASLARQAVGVAAASLPAAAHALEGDGINGAIKRTFAEFLGPYADAAPIVGTLVFVGIFAIQTGVGQSAPEAPATPSEDDAGK